MAKTSTTSRTGKPAAGITVNDAAKRRAALFLGPFGRRSQAEIEIGGFQWVFVLPQSRIVRRHRDGKSVRQRFVDQAGPFELVDARKVGKRA